MSVLQELHGTVAPNMALDQWRALPDGPVLGATAYWDQVHTRGHIRWWLGHVRDHAPDTFAVAKALGLRTVGRVGEGGQVNWEEVERALQSYGPLLDVLQIGNEPAVRDWSHAWYMEQVFNHCTALAYRLGVRLATPGWASGLYPPGANAQVGTLDQRLHAVYSRAALIGFHGYDPAAIFNPLPGGEQPTLTRLQAWQHSFAHQELLVSEYGIPYKYVGGALSKYLGDLIKADRLYAALGAFAGWPGVRVAAACQFISGGNLGRASFDDNEENYVPNGQNSYWLTPDAWTKLGALVGR